MRNLTQRNARLVLMCAARIGELIHTYTAVGELELRCIGIVSAARIAEEPVHRGLV
jgi:hypothetical protein